MKGVNKAKLVCDIDTITLDDESFANEYEALSYCWGDPERICSILVGDAGAVMTITRNLHQALLKLRNATTVRRLWIDAICINQADEDEKSSQVRLMHRVYRAAVNVLIWIDEPLRRVRGWDPASAFVVAERLYHLSIFHPCTDWNNNTFWYKLKSAYQLRLLSYLHAFRSLRLVFSRPWFERMWVIQEVSCSRTATVICGSARISFDHLIIGAKFGLEKRILQSYSGRQMINTRPDQRQPGSQSTAIQMYTIKVRDADAQENLLDYLQRFSTSKCQDPRDKIYALYGISELPYEHTLAQAFRIKDLQPDYRVNVTKLYMEVSKTCLTEGTLDVLSKPCPQPLSQSYSLPTWVIDWAAFDKADAFASLAATRRFQSTLTSKAEPAISHDGKCTLTGIFVDTVNVVGKPLDRSSYSFHLIFDKRPGTMVMMYVFGWLQTLLNHIGAEELQRSTYFTGEDYLDVFLAMYVATRASYESRWYRPGLQTENRVSDDRILAAAQAIRPFISGFLSSSRFAYLRPAFYREFSMGIKFGHMLNFGPHDHQIVRERNVMISNEDYLGMCPCNTQPGDVIMLLKGGKVPFVLRPGNEHGSFHLLGEAYVHGIMQGEEYDESKCVPIVLL